MLKNTRFRTDILDNPRWEDDELLLSSMGHAHAKFATSRAELVEVKPYFQKLRRYARSADYRAMASFVLGVYSLADNDIPGAAQRFADANAAKPKWVDEPDDYFATTDPLYWVQLFPSREEFVKRYKEVRVATKALR